MNWPYHECQLPSIRKTPTSHHGAAHTPGARLLLSVVTLDAMDL